MERGKTVSDLIDVQDTWDRNKQDIFIPYPKLVLTEPMVRPCEKGSQLRLATYDSSHPAQPILGHTFTDRAKGQFCAAHGLPRERWDRVEAEGELGVRSTWKDHVNTCLHTGFGYKGKKEERLVRIYVPSGSQDPYGPIVRSYLSNRYGSYTNKEMLTRLESAMKQMDSSWAILNYHHSLDRLIVKVISKNKVSHSDRGALHAGVCIGNAEDGSGSIEVLGFVADDYCLNGLVFSSAETATFRRKHIGSPILLQHHVNLALAEAFQMADKMMLGFLDMTREEIQSPLEIIDAIIAKRSKRPGFNEVFANTAKTIYNTYQQQHGDTMFSVVSSLTQAAQGLPDEIQLSVEKDMGEFVASRISTRS